MKLDIQKQHLEPALRAAGAAINSRISLPILSCLKLSATKDGFEIAGTNIDQFITCHAEAEVIEPGEVCVGARLFSQIVSRCGDSIHLELSNNRLSIDSDGMQARIFTIAAAEFPAAPNVDEMSEPVTIDAQAFRAALEQVRGCIDTDESVPWRGNMVIKQLEDGLCLVSTNGRILALRRKVAQGKLPRSIVPRDAVELFRSALADGETKIQVSGSVIRVSQADRSLSSKLSELNFPDWRQIMPADDYGKSLTVPREELLEAVEAAQVGTSNTSPKIILSADGKRLSVSAQSAEVGEIVRTAGKIKEKFRIGLSPVYFGTALRAHEAEEVTIRISDEVSPVVITSGDLKHVMLPMRINP